MPYIYKITNDINNKVYIGKTIFSIEKRFNEHCQDCYKKQNEQRPLYTAMRKYGIEHFHIEQIEETDTPEEREQYWIAYYNSYHNGYNATLGGDGKSYIDYDEVIDKYNELKCIKDVADNLNISVDSVSAILDTRHVAKMSIQDVIILKKGKRVGMYNLNDELLLEFDSISKAAIYLKENNYVNGNLHSVSSHISDTCHNKRKTVGGFKWHFI